jgi:hypothetical protein
LSFHPFKIAHGGLPLAALLPFLSMSYPSKPRVDLRCSGLGQLIPTENYCDQPYVVRADDGAWVCVVTTGVGHEGDPGQVVVSHRSTDHGHTWETPVLLEPADGPVASYAVALKTPTGRIYAFYNHNTDNVREIPREDGGVFKRVDSLGHYVFKFSDDHGKTWSAQRYEIPIRKFDIDLKNPYGGDPVRFFWNVGRPIISADGSVFLPHTKVGSMGVGFYAQSEGVFLRSTNILTEQDPSKISWSTLPDGDVGLRPPADSGRVAEEHTIVELSDGSLYTVYRTVGGHPACSYSRDRGRTWDTPSYKRFSPEGRLFKHARAANFVWKTSEGRYLYWFHNQGGPIKTPLGPRWVGHEAYQDRNPAWITAGREVDSPRGKIIVWSEPEILLYDDDPAARLSYPDLIEENGRFWVTETQKTIARVHEIEPRLIDTILRQHEITGFAEDDLLVHVSAPAPVLDPMPVLPEFRWRHLGGSQASEDTRFGFTLDFDVGNLPEDGGVLFDTINANGEGLRITSDAGRRLTLRMSDPRQTVEWASDPLGAGPHHVSFIVDGGAHTILVVVDGHLQDGGNTRQFGWGRFSPTLAQCNGNESARVSAAISELRIYGRALLVSEAVGNSVAAASLVVTP